MREEEEEEHVMIKSWFRFYSTTETDPFPGFYKQTKQAGRNLATSFSMPAPSYVKSVLVSDLTHLV